ncbi:MAG: DUF4868 domain-containing protein [Methanomicrobiales archaeon]|nr:DUF4868 domain-containing protein [Methanomicrobiales archaeon]MDI6877671.1 DUF4868 domain-containing protein [Methanomicrobiales archaeon]
MIAELIGYINQSHKENVNLYFAKKNKNQTTKEVTYEFFKARIHPDIGEELRRNALSQMIRLHEKNPQYMEYGILPYSDSPIIEKIKNDDVPNLPSFLSSTANPRLSVITKDDFNKVFGYIVKIETGNITVFFFRKYSPKKLMEKGKLAVIFRDGQFSTLNENILALDSVYDAALLMRPPTPQTQTILPEVLVFHKSQFESLFSFIDFYLVEVQNKEEYLSAKEFFDDCGKIFECCTTDARKIRKLARVLKNSQIDQMDRDKIRRVVDEFNLTLGFTDDGKLRVDEQSIWTILRILDDDYVKSDITNSKYESRSKVRK